MNRSNLLDRYEFIRKILDNYTEDMKMTNRRIGWNAADEARGYKIWTDEPNELLEAALLQPPEAPKKGPLFIDPTPEKTDATLKELIPGLISIVRVGNEGLQITTKKEMGFAKLSAVAAITHMDFELATGSSEGHYYVFGA